MFSVLSKTILKNSFQKTETNQAVRYLHPNLLLLILFIPCADIGYQLVLSLQIPSKRFFSEQVYYPHLQWWRWHAKAALATPALSIPLPAAPLLQTRKLRQKKNNLKMMEMVKKMATMAAHHLLHETPFMAAAAFSS